MYVSLFFAYISSELDTASPTKAKQFSPPPNLTKIHTQTHPLFKKIIYSILFEFYFLCTIQARSTRKPLKQNRSLNRQVNRSTHMPSIFFKISLRLKMHQNSTHTPEIKSFSTPFIWPVTYSPIHIWQIYSKVYTEKKTKTLVLQIWQNSQIWTKIHRKPSVLVLLWTGLPRRNRGLSSQHRYVG